MEINTQEKAEGAVTKFLDSLVSPVAAGSVRSLRELLGEHNHLIAYTLEALIREAAMRNIELSISGKQH